MMPRTYFRVLWAGSLLLAVGCSSERSPVGGESHFACRVDSDCERVSGNLVCIERECRPRAGRGLGVTGEDAGGLRDAGDTGRVAGDSGLFVGDARPLVPDSSARDGGFTVDAAGSDLDGAPAPLLPPGERISCAELDSGFDGDEYCLDVPSIGEGFLLHFGPTDYDDPDDVADFILPPGEEAHDCVAQRLTNPEDAFVAGAEGGARPGTHSLRASLSSSSVGSARPGACRPLDDTMPIYWAESTRSEQAPAPEHAGVATRIPADARVSIRLSSVNPQSVPILREAWVFLKRMAEADVTATKRPLRFYGGLSMSVPPGETERLGNELPCQVPEASEVMSLVADTGYTTSRVSAYVERAATPGTRTLVYETYDWLEPDHLRFDSVAVNEAPNEALGLGGGWSGPLVLEPGDRLWWECDMENTGEAPLEYGDEYHQNRCNIVGTFVSGGDSPWLCFF